MFKRLLGLGRNPNRDIADRLYVQIVAAARQPALYSDWNVPDTPLGRFEMLSLHVFLFMRRAKAGGEALEGLAQQLTDDFFLELDHSLRELGIGDMGVPKRMKKLARMFYGRTASYGAALDAGDEAALAAAIARNVRPDAADWAEAPKLARYALASERALAAQGTATLLAGEIVFPAAEEMAHG